MAHVTLTVLEGLERGQVLRDLKTPVTIGREEENDLQLNDERISRLHAKLQEDHGQILFTDLNSTNGSRVNGHPVQLRVLRPGDHLQIGRCTLLFGTDEEIAERAHRLGVEIASLLPLSGPSARDVPAGGQEDASFSVADNLTGEHMLEPLFPGERPPLPSELTPGQIARLSDVIMFMHERLKYLMLEAREQEGEPPQVQEVSWERWQDLMLMQRDLAEYLQEIANPE
jgi:FHA domain